MGISRRDLLATATAAALAPVPALGSRRPRSFRVVHMTDFHIQPELRAAEGVATSWAHAMSLDPSPDLVITGGDLVMDASAADEKRAKTQWDLFTRLQRENVKVPVIHTIGNHDVWGWNKEKSGTDGTEARWGKRWFCDSLGQDRTFGSHRHGGWKIVVLDNISQTPDGYNAVVDDEQLEWFVGEITTEEPTLVVSHIPLITPSVLVYGYDKQKGDWTVGGNVMTKNFAAIKRAFDTRPNVKLCVSGHIHLVDRYDFNGVSYLCNGAVSGAWWMGRHHDFAPGYVVIDLAEDGTWSHRFETWGWTAG